LSTAEARKFRKKEAEIDKGGPVVREAKTDVRMRIVIEQPVMGVVHSLQDKDGLPLDPKKSVSGEPLTFDFVIRIAAGPKFFGDQVRREGPHRRFVYVRIGQLAGDPASPWSRRMKIDIHDIEQQVLDRAIDEGRTIRLSVEGAAADGTPACATIPVTKSWEA
jgi:hypothetical protein